MTGADEDATTVTVPVEEEVPEFELDDVEGSLRSQVPEDLVVFLHSICREDWLIDEVLYSASTKVLRRLRHGSPAAQIARWSKRWEENQQPATKRWLGRIRDRVLTEFHRGEVASHKSPDVSLHYLYKASSAAGAQLIVDDPDVGVPAVGVASYLEATPPEVVASAFRSWQVDNPLNRPKVWDLTAGAGTVTDFFSTIAGAAIVASDTAVGAATGVVLADCRSVGQLRQHQQKSSRGVFDPGLVIPRPDLIYFDPPSRGYPSHAELYLGCVAADLAGLSRGQWIEAVVTTVRKAVERLAPGGLVSVVLRYGRRAGAAVLDEESTLHDVRSALGGSVNIEQEQRLVFRVLRNQVSLGASRVPAAHLLVSGSR